MSGEGGMMDPERIVLGVDFTGGMLRAAPWIQRHLAPQAGLTLVHAVERVEPPAYLRRLLPANGNLAQRRRLEDAKRRLREWSRAARIRSAGVVVREGRPDQV